jgi:hypothetical protein
MDQIHRSNEFVRSLSSFTIDADTTKDEIVHHDFKVQRAAQVHVVLQQLPARLLAEVRGDQGERRYTYDGRFLAVETKAPNQHYYSAVNAPTTLRELLDVAHQDYGVEFPLADVLYVASGTAVTERILAAGDLGPSEVGGVPCEQVAVRTKAVDWQVCIAQGERPLPLRVVVTTRGSPAGLQSSAVLHWDLDAPIQDEMFAFKKPEGATRISFTPPALARVQAKSRENAR